MNYRIHFEYADGTTDSVVLSGATIDEIRTAAQKAMQGLITALIPRGALEEAESIGPLASVSYLVADAMLAAREEK